MKITNYLLSQDKKFYFLCLAILLLVFLFLGWLVWGSTRWRTQVHEVGGYSVSVPILWRMESYRAGYKSWPELTLEKDNTIWSSGSFRVMQLVMEAPTLEDASEWGAELIERHGGSEISDLEEVIVGNNVPAFKRTYYRRYFNQGYYEVYYFVSDDMMYALEFGSKSDEFDELNSTFTQVRDSFQILEH